VVTDAILDSWTEAAADYEPVAMAADSPDQ
jgi:hypothetical protein